MHRLLGLPPKLPQNVQRHLSRHSSSSFSHVVSRFLLEIVLSSNQHRQAGAEDEDSIGERYLPWRIGTCCITLAQFEPVMYPVVDIANRQQMGQGDLKCRH